ncbi:MAG: hypothetical protein H6737_27780 [Alphaproteobacteria bacterium]|nr:hypothetical protein [Alphaproteobacteria bacterium]
MTRPPPSIRRARLLALLGIAVAAPASAEPNPFDRDGDLIADSVDKCPDEKEDYNGYVDDDGCPDQRIVDLLGIPEPKPSILVPKPVPSLLIPKPEPAPGLLLPKPEPAPVLLLPVEPRPTLVPPKPGSLPALGADLPPDSFTCTGEVERFDSLLGAFFRCDGDPSRWWVTPGIDMDFPDVVRTGARGKVVLKRNGPDGAILVSFQTSDGVIHVPQPEPDGCFLTTAVTRSRGLPDDCAELQAMRAFRDGWLGPEHPDVRRYYAVAPAIVAAIDAREDADAVWDIVRVDYLEPILALVGEGRNEQAHAAYRQLVDDLLAGTRA